MNTEEQEREQWNQKLTCLHIVNFIQAFTLGANLNGVGVEWIKGERVRNYEVIEDRERERFLKACVTTKRWAYMIEADEEQNVLFVRVARKEKYRQAAGWDFSMLESGDMSMGSWCRILRDMFVNEAVIE